ncbi:MAG: 1-acyl-sn-glycerol-3-phosphate acyltransferase [Bacteroidetes bacterium]|nr:1-acyl-sn-glycerol-3-phosphate acyltransferase [Bacteroidota bacterium]
MANKTFNISVYFSTHRKPVGGILFIVFTLLCYFASQLQFEDNPNGDFQHWGHSGSTIFISLCLFVLLYYGRIELALLTLLPAFCTIICLMGALDILKSPISEGSFIFASIIVGIASTLSSMIIMHAQLQLYKTGVKRFSFKKPMMVSLGIGIIICLCLLCFYTYRSLTTVLLLVTCGILVGNFLSHALLPALFHFLISNRTDRKLFPWTFSGLALSAFAFAYFVVASLVLTLLGLVFVKLNPFNKEKGKRFYHISISKFCWSLMYIMGNVKKQIINPLQEDFSKPAVIVCNHQSFLDILSTVMLYPKLILFTNHWVWNSPVFGFVVRMADYYPVMQGADGSIDRVSDRVKNGYSVVVFPEGTRSVDGAIKRFHKGAFFLAEKLNLDILPILIHGTGYTMSKGDFLLKNGSVTLTILPRIKPDHFSFGIGYAERSKSIGRYFRKELGSIKQQFETTSYFREQLIYNYIYKGPVLEWYMRIKLKLEKNYQLFDELLPKTGNILDAGCGYGFMSYMLHFVSTERKLIGVDYDEKKINTANHCFSRDENIHFISSNLLDFQYGKYDGIILSDVLHYLQPEQQKQVIENCLESLNLHGILIIRDGDKDLKERHKGTIITEFFSTRFSGFNKTTENGLSFLSGSLIREIAQVKKMGFEEIDPSKLTSNKIFVIKKNAATDYAAV